MQDYGVSIILFESHYLVDIEVEAIGRVLKLDSMKNGNIWKDMDVLVFTNWLWWYRRGPKQPYEFYKIIHFVSILCENKKQNVSLK